jgi:phage recombination protein Bet
MTAAIQTTNVVAMSTAPAPFFSEAQEQMLLKTFLGGATRDEAMVLMETVRRRRLDPFSRQVYFIKRWDSAKREEVWAIQTSIDGLRSIAERTGKYDGQDEPEYGKDEAGEFCKVKVYRKDWSPNRYAMGIAYLAEFIQKKKDGGVTSFWARMPRLMLAKCAEALAIRKAFPEDTGGLYIAEEMGQEPPAEHNIPPPSLPPQQDEIRAPAVEAAKVVTKKAANAKAIQIWSRLVDECGGDKKVAMGKFETAATTHFGVTTPPTSDWTDEDCAAVEQILFDVPF